MKLALLAGIALFATPAFAQNQPAQAAPAPADQAAAPSAQTPPAGGQVPNTPLSTSPTPADGARAQEGNLPSNNAASAAGGGEQPAMPPQDMPAAPGQTATPVPSEPVATALPPAPAALDHYPICKAGQFDKCMEPGNHGGGKAATHRRKRK